MSIVTRSSARHCAGLGPPSVGSGPTRQGRAEGRGRAPAAMGRRAAPARLHTPECRGRAPCRPDRTGQPRGGGCPRALAPGRASVHRSARSPPARVFDVEADLLARLTARAEQPTTSCRVGAEVAGRDLTMPKARSSPHQVAPHSSSSTKVWRRWQDHHPGPRPRAARVKPQVALQRLGAAGVHQRLASRSCLQPPRAGPGRAVEDAARAWPSMEFSSKNGATSLLL